LRVAVLGGGRSTQHGVSLSSAAAVREGLQAAGHEVVPITIERSGVWLQNRARLALRPAEGLLDCDVVFPVLHGPFGEDGTVQGLLELLDIPYVGATVRASALCMDKVAFKNELTAAGMPQVRYVAVPETRWRKHPEAVRADITELGLPVFVKPARLGSSVGILKASEAEQLEPALETAFTHDGLAIVEQFSPGIEVKCAVLGLDEPEVSLPGEIVLPEADWYDYQLKHKSSGVELVVPARIGADLTEEVQRLARETFLYVGCACLARVDFFVEGDRIRISKLNTLPGFTPTSAFPKLWDESGVPFAELCDRLLSYALERFRTDRGVHVF
jgi:D-alanine-D-alanine ligase